MNVFEENVITLRFCIGMNLNRNGDLSNSPEFEVNPLKISEFLGSKEETEIQKRLTACVDSVCYNHLNFKPETFINGLWEEAYHSGASIAVEHKGLKAGEAYGTIDAKLSISYRTSNNPETEQEVTVASSREDLNNVYLWIRLLCERDSPFSLSDIDKLISEFY
ncbi:MAG: hypothetical protein AAFP97_07825, partial [Pseudomonadota bacterium]